MEPEVNNEPFLAHIETIKNMENLKLIGASFGVGFVSGYIYSVVGVVDLIVLGTIVTAAMNIKNIKNAYKQYNSNSNVASAVNEDLTGIYYYINKIYSFKK